VLPHGDKYINISLIEILVSQFPFTFAMEVSLENLRSFYIDTKMFRIERWSVYTE